LQIRDSAFHPCYAFQHDKPFTAAAIASAAAPTAGTATTTARASAHSGQAAGALSALRQPGHPRQGQAPQET